MKCCTNGSRAATTTARIAPAVIAIDHVRRPECAGRSVQEQSGRDERQHRDIGRMYDGSFDPDALKKASTNPAQTQGERCHEKSRWAGCPSRQVRRRPGKQQDPGNGAGDDERQEIPPGSSRPVRGREVALESDSWTKKNRKNSFVARDTATNRAQSGREYSASPVAQVQPPPDGEVAGDERIEDERCAGNDDRRSGLRQRRAGHRRPGDPHPVAALARRRGRALREREGAEGGRSGTRPARRQRQHVRR